MGELVFNATFNNSSVILVEETGIPGENHRATPSHWLTLSHNVVSGIRIHNFNGDMHCCIWYLILDWNTSKDLLKGIY